MFAELIGSLHKHLFVYMREIDKMNDFEAQTKAETNTVWNEIVNGWDSYAAFLK